MSFGWIKLLVLDCAVDALGHGVVFRVAALGHAWHDTIGNAAAEAISRMVSPTFSLF